MADYAVVNPATGETVKEYPTISDGDLKAAIGAADQASHEWVPTTSVQERAEMIRKVGALHAEREQQLAEIIVREMGKPIEQARGEVGFCQAIYDYYADNGPELLKDEPVTLSEGEGSAFIRRRAARMCPAAVAAAAKRGCSAAGGRPRARSCQPRT